MASAADTHSPYAAPETPVDLLPYPWPLQWLAGVLILMLVQAALTWMCLWLVISRILRDPLAVILMLTLAFSVPAAVSARIVSRDHHRLGSHCRMLILNLLILAVTAASFALFIVIVFGEPVPWKSFELAWNPWLLSVAFSVLVTEVTVRRQSTRRSVREART